MNKKIKILIIMSLMFLTGCTIKYDLVIDSNLNINETISVTENNSVLGKYNQNIKTVPKSTFNQYKKISYFSDYELQKEIFNDNETGAVVKNNFNENEYQNAMTVKNLFDSVSIEQSSPYVSFLYSDFNSSFFVSEGTLDENVQFKDIEVNIRLHNEVVEHNADSCNKDTNTCTWVLGENTPNKTIFLKIDTDSKRYDIIFIDFINNNLLTIILIGSLALIGIIAYFVVINKNRSINKI